MDICTDKKAYYVDLDKIANHMTVQINNYWSLQDAADEGNGQCSIYRVPEHIREVDRNAYEPIILAIGPYHHGSQVLSAIETEKMRCLNFIINLNCSRSLQGYVALVLKLEKDARSCYSEDMKLERKMFVRMLLLDACFILVKVEGTVTTLVPKHAPSKNANLDPVDESVDQLKNKTTCIAESSAEYTYALPGAAHEAEQNDIEANRQEGKNASLLHDEGSHRLDSYDYSTTGDWYSNLSWHDLFLLENQIPLFVIERLYNYIMDAAAMTMRPLFTTRISECIEDALRQYPNNTLEPDRSKKFCHLLHLCQAYLKPSQRDYVFHHHQTRPRYLCQLLHFGERYFGLGSRSRTNLQNQQEMQQMDCFQDGQLPSRWRQATQYHEAGVSLKKREYSEYDRHTLLDIKFRNGVVEVPCFPIDENTESLFKNLVAFEQTDPQFGNDITAYIVFMSQFVTTPDDVTLLTQRGIIVHALDSDDEVSALFARLTKQVFFDCYGEYYLKSLCHALEAHYQSRLNRWVAWLWRNHFSNPWLALGVFAAVVVLICTLVQTVYTVLAYVNPLA